MARVWEITATCTIRRGDQDPDPGSSTQVAMSTVLPTKAAMATTNTATVTMASMTPVITTAAITVTSKGTLRIMIWTTASGRYTFPHTTAHSLEAQHLAAAVA